MRRLAALLLLVACVPPEPPEMALLKPLGLYTSPNEHGEIPAGALATADDVVISKDKVAEKRRGQGPALSSGASKMWPFADRLLLHKDSTLSYTDTGVTTKTDYAATIAAPTGRRLRAAFGNSNAYLASSTGVKRLDSVTGSPVDAGVPMGLDVSGALTGSSGFLADDSAAAARVVWGLRDANGNLLLGAPSGRAVLTNSAGGSRDVIWSTSIPSGLTSSHFWQLYRTANAVTAATDPGDEMGLVYEGTVPQAASITQLVRLTNVVTATTSAAHGYAVGQIVKVSPGGVAGSPVFAAVGASTDAASSADGITWTDRTIASNDHFGVAWNGTVFAAVGGSGSTNAATSPDGVTWTTRTLSGTHLAVAWGGSVFASVGTLVAATSPDGITWTARTMPETGYRGVAWSGSLFVAVGTNVCATSPDGITWTARTIPAGTYNAVAWNGTVFAAIGLSGAVATSPDGVTWTDRTGPAGDYNGVAWSGSIFAAVGVSAAATSPDGVTWTVRTIPAGTYNGVAWNGTVFAAVGNATKCATSPDGITWTSRTIAAGTYYAVAVSGTVFASGEYAIATVPLTTTFTYAETGTDGTLVQTNTATPLTAAVTDSIPSTFAGATLYTSQSQAGILASQYEPPSCVDIATFRGSTFWLGTTDKATLDFWVLAAGGTSGIQANDTITINGTVFTAKATEVIGSREFAVTTTGTASTNVRDTAASLIRVVNRAQGSAVYARDVSGSNDQPGHVELVARARADSITISVSRAASWALTDGTTAAPESNPHRLMWSQSDRPDAATVTGYQDIGSKDKDGLRVIALRDSLFILKEDGIWRATGDSFDHQFPPTLAPFDTSTEIVAPESAVVLDNVIFALSTKGVVQISDTGVTILSRSIEDQIRPLLVEPLLATVRTVAHGVAYEADGRYILWVPDSSDDTEATEAFVYDHFASIATGAPVWTMRTDDAATALVNPYDGKLYVGASATVTKERKALTYADLADGEVSVTVDSGTGPVVLASATGVAAGDMLVNGSNRAVVLSVASNTLTLDRAWAGGTGAATVYKAIPSVVEFAPFIPVPGAWSHFQETSLLFRKWSAGYMTEEFATELAPTWGTVGFFGSRDYGTDESTASAINLRTWVTKEHQKAERLKIKITHTQAMSPFELEGVSVISAPISVRLRR